MRPHPERRPRPRPRRRLAVAVTALAAATALLLTGCTTENDALADQYLNGDNKGYISGDGTVTEIPEADRGEPVEFAGTDEDGEPVSSADYAGEVLVVNFWYAGCAPCRAEAPDLQKLSADYEGKGASFLGVNVRDQAATAKAFSENYGIGYPSVVDTDGALQLAFAGKISPKAVPTTLVLDKEGRVAARIVGRVSEPSILDTLITSSLDPASTPTSTPAAAGAS